jgi:hypothetical protein
LELDLTVLPVADTLHLTDSFTVTLYNYVYSDNDFVIVNPETKTYYRHEQTDIGGCDSIIELSLTVFYDTIASELANLDSIIVENGSGDDFPLVPSFSDTVYDYSVILPCEPVSHQINVIALSRHQGAEITYLGAADSNGWLVISEDATGDHTVIIAVKNGDISREYTVTFRQRFSTLILQHLWDDVMTVNINPDSNGGYIFTGFQWYLDNEAIVGATGRYLLQNGGLQSGHNYYATLLDITGKTFETCPYLYLDDDVMSIHPNPIARGSILTVELSDIPASGEVLLYDIGGRLLRRYALSEKQHILHIPVTLHQGMYMLRAGNKVQKFIVVK